MASRGINSDAIRFGARRVDAADRSLAGAIDSPSNGSPAQVAILRGLQIIARVAGSHLSRTSRPRKGLCDAGDSVLQSVNTQARMIIPSV